MKILYPEIKIIWQRPDSLGEGPLWQPKENALYWIDIAEKKLQRIELTTQHYQYWNMPDFIGCIALRAQGGFIAGIGDEICFIEMPSGNVFPQKKVPGGLRLNDGKCDPLGNFWIGNADPKNHQACLYRYDADGQLQKMAEHIYISNGMGWSLDTRIFYYSDSLGGKIYTYDYDHQTAKISNRKIFADIPNADGEPDGLTIDREGYIWSARWNGGKIVRYAPDGNVDYEIIMPVKRPTSCIFGSEDFNTLYITSCSRDINEKQKLNPPAGALFAVKLNIKGIAEFEFKG